MFFSIFYTILATYVKNNSTFDYEMIKRFTKQLTTAVAANVELVIHRDIKIENILTETRSNSEPMLKLADFGCALIIKSGQRISDQIGTLRKAYELFEY